jgi:hypothetical protein
LISVRKKLEVENWSHNTSSDTIEGAFTDPPIPREIVGMRGFINGYGGSLK